MRHDSKPSFPAFVTASLSLFLILYQFRLIAGELSDAPIFIGALTGAFLLGLILGYKNIGKLKALGIIALFPWGIRFIPYILGFASSGPSIILDSFILHLDRNLFVLLFPWYWAATSAYGYTRSRFLLRFGTLLSNIPLVLLCILFPTQSLKAYQMPVNMVVLFAILVALQLITLILSTEPLLRPSRGERRAAIASTLTIVILTALFLIKPAQDRAVSQGGGLLKPNLYHFDFSQFLRLESEITLNDDLALIVRKEEDDSHILLRRFILSGYHPKQGFYRHEERDEATHPQRLSDHPQDYPGEEPLNGKTIYQEYFLVNFDPSAFIAINRPARVIPFTVWDAASFNSAYAVESAVTDSFPFELIDAVPGPVNAETLGLREEEYLWYTNYGDDPRIAEYSQELVSGLTGYWDRVQSIYERLRYGEYRYSLKPGVAADGDQLGRFLFDTKKGYCSYFAFSMALLLRAQGIPARVAVGFFLDPQTNTFNYYPIRSDMAHAWVEVLYPGYGWVEYDPTTDMVAEGEDIQFTRGIPQDVFERLMKEILKNKDRLVPKVENTELTDSFLSRFTEKTLYFVHTTWPYLLLFLFVLMSFFHRASLLIASHFYFLSPRRRTQILIQHILLRLRLGGVKKLHTESYMEFASRLETNGFIPLIGIFENFAAARFAALYTSAEYKDLIRLYRQFNESYKKKVRPVRRILTWIFPPLALWMPYKATPVQKAIVPVFLILSFFNADYGGAQGRENSADVLLEAAMDAQGKENWDRAIGLLEEGGRSYPGDVRFSWSLGELYQSRMLYSLAWEAYREAEKIENEDPELLYQLSVVAGRLNKDDLSIAYLERLLTIHPDHRDAIGDLGWMYFKTHRLGEGEALLLDALSRLGPDRGFSMTLGTIYADQFNYEQSKACYLESIADAEANDSPIFAAVAHYNLSILESRHYNYAESFDRTAASLAAADRSSGHLARGELYLRRLEFSKTFAEYLAAYGMDNSPLSKINLAQAYQYSGRLQEALAYSQETLSMQDLSWMLNYGTDIDRHRRDLHDILHNTFSGLRQSTQLKPSGTLSDYLNDLWNIFKYAISAQAQRHLYTLYSLKTAHAYAAEGQELDAFINYYNAFEAYPQRARHYLKAARDFETALIPEAGPSYELEEGILLNNRDLVKESIPRLDPVWERDLLADAYAYLAKASSFTVPEQERLDAAERLYALNRGALRQRGIRLPVNLEVQSKVQVKTPEKTEKSLARLLRDIGIRPYSEASYSGRYRLTIRLLEGEAECMLQDVTRGYTILRRTIPFPSLEKKDQRSFGNTLAELFFIAD